MDRIWLRGVECRVRLGVPAWERKKLQKVLIDVGMELDLRAAGKSDEAGDTVDYWAVERAVRRRARTGSRRLAERLAAELARAVLGLDRRIRRVSVAVRKKPAVMPGTEEVIVEVRRVRSWRRNGWFPKGARKRRGAFGSVRSGR